MAVTSSSIRRCGKTTGAEHTPPLRTTRATTTADARATKATPMTMPATAPPDSRPRDVEFVTGGRDAGEWVETGTGSTDGSGTIPGYLSETNERVKN